MPGCNMFFMIRADLWIPYELDLKSVLTHNNDLNRTFMEMAYIVENLEKKYLHMTFLEIIWTCTAFWGVISYFFGTFWNSKWLENGYKDMTWQEKYVVETIMLNFETPC